MSTWRRFAGLAGWPFATFVLAELFLHAFMLAGLPHTQAVIIAAVITLAILAPLYHRYRRS